MRIYLITLLCFFSLSASAKDDKSIQDLFKKYDAVMDMKKVELIDEVFSEKFIKTSGGKKELTQKIKELETPPSLPKTRVSWKKGNKGKIYLATVKDLSSQKSKTEKHETEFIVIEEDGKLKIDGTLGDSN